MCSMAIIRFESLWLRLRGMHGRRWCWRTCSFLQDGEFQELEALGLYRHFIGIHSWNNMCDQQSQAPTTHPKPLDDGMTVDAPA